MSAEVCSVVWPVGSADLEPLVAPRVPVGRTDVASSEFGGRVCRAVGVIEGAGVADGCGVSEASISVRFSS